MSDDMKPSEVLRKARKLITPEGAWIQGEPARDEEGNPIAFSEDDAVCFCSYGAIWHVADIYTPLADESERFLEHMIDDDSIDHWNDVEGRTQADVAEAFDKAAALAEAEGN